MQFKSSKYKYIPSKVYEPKKKTGFQYEENNYMNYNQYQQQNNQKKKIVRPNSAFIGSNKLKPTLNSQEQKNINNNIINNFNESKPSMFEQYYKGKIENKEEQIQEVPENQNEIKNIQIKKDIEISNNELNNKKDYIEENKHLITKIQNANNSNKLKEYYDKKENPYHKEYGKTPKYIQDMRLENEKKKEMEKLKKETAKYPKGTRLLSEEERISTLEKLKQSRDDINKIIERLPITCDSQAFRNKKDELFKKLDEIENAIETFSKKKVFVKIEN